jgi:Restriction alleviation protein Lar
VASDPVPPQTTNRPSLLSCPFCGAREDALVVEGDRWHQSVYCNGCETGGPTKSVPHSVRSHLLTEADTARAAIEAITAWNRRVQDVSAYGGAAHMCDAISADIRREHTIKRGWKAGQVSDVGEAMAFAVKRAGDAILDMHEALKETSRG